MADKGKQRSREAVPDNKGSTSVKLYTAWGDRVYYAITVAMLWIALILVAIPLIFVLASSFSSAEAIQAGRVLLWPVEFNVRGYQLIFRTQAILDGYRNSLIYMVSGTAINLVMTFLFAYPLSRKDFQGRTFMTIFMTITMFFSGGLIPSYLLVRGLNMLDTIWAMIIPGAMSVWNVIIVRTYISSNVPFELYECASIEGCGDFRYVLRFVLPLCVPIVAVMALLYAVGHWNGYFSAMIYLSTRTKYPLQLVLRDILVLNMGVGSPQDVERQRELQLFSYLLKYSTIVVASLPMMIAYPFVQRFFIRGIMIGAIKG